MRIQHNVTALNAYRNLRGNNLALARNLEKLSSGYRINRAGDDAAGLAISEKMRAQITGLDAAQKNAEDGISLVQTAEGALTEVHSMLNRMVTLATQSSNGTYDNEVDRANLQKEVVALKAEIDRISESANFNGINLLDGSMSNEALLRGEIKVGMPTAVAATDLKAQAGKQEVEFKDVETANGAKAKEKIAVSFNYKVGDGPEKTKTIELKIKTDGAKNYAVDEKGVEYVLADTDGAITAKELVKAVEATLKSDKEISSLFDINATTDGKFEFTAKEKGLGGATVVAASVDAYNSDGALKVASHDTITVKGITAATDAGMAYDLSKEIVFGSEKGAYTDVADINKAIFEINGEKFIFVDQDLSEAQWDAVVKSGAHHVAVNASAAKPTADDVAEMARKISTVTNLTAENGTVDTGVFTADAAGTHLRVQHSGKAVDRSLTLQIGDTADDFNKMKVSIQSTSTKSLKIADVDISTQDGAAAAISKVKNAINTVSSVRGDMGALQNRLEHTIANLGVMHENITDAESRIRDTDMAKEMMAYAKNNILVQSSTAMLAQANMLPQSVLQLLQ